MDQHQEPKLNKVSNTILRQGWENEVRDQFAVFLALAVAFVLGAVFMFFYSQEQLHAFGYLGLSVGYLFLASGYKRSNSKQSYLLRVFRFYCVHTSIEFFLALYPDFVSEEDKEIVRRMDKGLILLIILFSLKYGYLLLRLALVFHFYRVLGLFRKIDAVTDTTES